MAFSRGQSVVIKGVAGRADLEGLEATILSTEGDDIYGLRVNSTSECVDVPAAHVEAAKGAPSAGAPTTGADEAGGGAELATPSAWRAGLDDERAYEWIVDCYRMRVDDDMTLGGGCMHGLYNPSCTDATQLADFLLFAKLAVSRGVVVADSSWDWSRFCSRAAVCLKSAFDQKDAAAKYGEASSGGRSLRFTAEQVYGVSCEVQERDPFVGIIKQQVGDALFPGRAGADDDEDDFDDEGKGASFEHTAVFEDVGGVHAWRELLARLSAPRA